LLAIERKLRLEDNEERIDLPIFFLA